MTLPTPLNLPALRGTQDREQPTSNPGPGAAGPRVGDYVVYRRPDRFLAGGDDATGLGYIRELRADRFAVCDLHTPYVYELRAEFLRVIPPQEIMRDLDEALARGAVPRTS